VIETLTNQAIDYRLFIEEIVEQIRLLLHEKVGITKSVSPYQFSIRELERLADLCNEAYKGLRGSVLPQLPLELVVLRWCVLEQNQEKTVIASETKQTHVHTEQAVVNEKVEKVTVTQEKGSSGSANPFLYQLIDAIKHDNAQIAGLLRGCSIESVTDTQVTISTKFEFHGKKLNEPKVEAMLEKTASDLLSKSVKIVVVLKN
jgi:DNA polymerase III gamma/tau subunit